MAAEVPRTYNLHQVVSVWNYFNKIRDRFFVSIVLVCCPIDMQITYNSSVTQLFSKNHLSIDLRASVVKNTVFKKNGVMPARIN